MRRYQRPGFAAVAGAFGLGLLLALTCSLRLALILAAIMILLLCRCILRGGTSETDGRVDSRKIVVWRSPRWLGGILQRLLRIS